MAVQTQPDRAQYRLIITRRRATEILLLTQLPGCTLPNLEVSIQDRVAEQLVSGVRKECRLETYCLLTGDLPTSERSTPDRYAVMESVRDDGTAPLGAIWISSAEAAANTGFPPADQTAVHSALEELARPEEGPFVKPGWIEDLFDWVQNQIGPLGLRPTGVFRQYNAAPTFSLMRIETNRTALWFKATGQPNQRELGISVTLDCLFPGYVPRVLAVHPIWNGWLSEETAGVTLDDSNDVRSWASAARALAKLQIASIAKTSVLLESGCRDLRLHQLQDQIAPFLGRVRESMTTQTVEPPRILSESNIGVLGERLEEALHGLGTSGIPSTLGHLDPNPGNIIGSSGRCCFLDWAQGSVTHPLFTFEYLFEHAQRAFPQVHGVRETLVAVYLEPWQSFFSPETLAQAMSVSPVLAVFACAVDCIACSPDAFRSPAYARYFRSLARRAYREATKMGARSDRCLP